MKTVLQKIASNINSVVGCGINFAGLFILCGIEQVQWVRRGTVL